MSTNRSFYLLVVMAVLVVTGCAPQATATPQPTSLPADPITPGAETEGWSEGLLPNGTWTVELSIEDFVGMGVPPSDAIGWEGVNTFTFQDGNAVFRHQADFDYECEATYEVVEDFVRITYSDSPTDQDVCNGVVEDVRWRLDDDGLHFHLVATQIAPFVEDKASYEAKPWQKSESPASTSHPFAGETSWIAYQTNRTGEGTWLVHPDGTEDHQIAEDFAGALMLPDWSPDGKKLVMASREAGDIEPLYEYDLESGTYRQLFACEDNCLGDDEPAYSPDGTKVAFIRYLLPFVYSEAIGEQVPSGCGLWIGDVATGEVRQITGKDQLCDLREASPRWSPNGSKIVYFRERYDNSGVTDAIFVINADGSEEQQLTEWDLVAGYPDWSPDGEWIVFATHPLFSFNFDQVVSNLYRMRPDGSEIEQLTFYETPDIRANQPRYTPDGKWIIFTAVQPSSNTQERKSDRSLWVIPAEGGEPIEITSGGIYTHGTWQP